MSEGSRWTPISDRSGSRLFGIYREPAGPSRRTSPNIIGCKLVLGLFVISAIALLAMIVCLKAAEPEEEHIIERPPHGRMHPGEDNYTAPIPTTGEEQPVDRMAVENPNDGATSRQARAFGAEEKARIINRSPVIDSIGYPNRPMVISSSAPGFPQLEGYRIPVRGLTSDLMSWVAPQQPPAVRFTGVYFGPAPSDPGVKSPYLNGHAYVSDPFVKFKPSHPAEINQLAIEPERGNRFSNRPRDSASGSSNRQPVHNQYSPPMRPRPLKLMLDIYPVQPEPTAPAAMEADPRSRRPKLTPTPTGRMVVHLNLYPKRATRISGRSSSEKEANQRMFEIAPGVDPTMEEDVVTTESTFLQEPTLPATTLLPPTSELTY